MLGGADFMNYVTGKLRLGKETLATISGYWDDCITIEDKRTGEKQTLWNPTPEVRLQRLKRWTVAPEDQLDYESDKMWSKVSAAIRQENQELATSEKTILEEAQRNATKMRMAHNDTWIPRCFELDPVTGESWHYRHADFRPWDQRNDVIQYESNCVIATKTRHKTPMIHEASIVSVERQTEAMRQLAAVAAAGPLLSRPSCKYSSVCFFFRPNLLIFSFRPSEFRQTSRSQSFHRSLKHSARKQIETGKSSFNQEQQHK